MRRTLRRMSPHVARYERMRERSDDFWSKLRTFEPDPTLSGPIGPINDDEPVQNNPLGSLGWSHWSQESHQSGETACPVSSG
jgi:hypothetical protein